MENILNDINISKNTFQDMMQYYLTNKGISLCSEQVDKQYNELDERISSLIYLNTDFKVRFSNDLLDLMCSAESESFYKGFELGIAIVKHIFSQETPTINLINRTPQPKPERQQEPTEPTELDNKLIKYITDTIPLITEKNKSKLQGMIEVLADPEYRNM